VFDTWEMKVPGNFRNDAAFLDLETVKVPCDWVSPAGEKLSRRWSAFLAGVAIAGSIVIVEATGSEEAFLTGVAEAVAPATTVVYRATRKFDEMILKGRYTYARRGPAPEPFYPAMPGAEDLEWVCERPDPTGEWEAMRERELASADVSATYENDSGLVLIHLLRDMAELIGAYGEPDKECAEWCRRVLTDSDFAEEVLFGDEEADE
jgi:hypothetical protein